MVGHILWVMDNSGFHHILFNCSAPEEVVNYRNMGYFIGFLKVSEIYFKLFPGLMEMKFLKEGSNIANKLSVSSEVTINVAKEYYRVKNILINNSPDNLQSFYKFIFIKMVCLWVNWKV